MHRYFVYVRIIIEAIAGKEEKERETKHTHGTRHARQRDYKNVGGLPPSRICGSREMQGYGCNIKYQQYCSRPPSFDTRKIRRGHGGICRPLPFWRGSVPRPASSLQKKSWNSKWLSRDCESLCVGNPATPSRARVSRDAEKRLLTAITDDQIENIFSLFL